MLITAGAIFVLLVLSAFFSGSETALTAASRPLMHQLAQDGNPRARLVNQLHDHKERLIGAILLGNNLVNILASALATSLLIDMFGEAGVIYATAVMTLLVLVFSEILPKTYAIRHANRAALGIAPWINAIVFVLTPIVRTINLFVRGVFVVFGFNLHTEDAYHDSMGVLRGTIELHADKENTGEHRHMLTSVLDLVEVQVGEIMIHRRYLETINIDDEPQSIVSQVLESAYSRMPLWQGNPDNIVGVIHAKALLREVQNLKNQGKELDELNVQSIAAKPWFVPEHTQLSSQLQAFRSRREHFSLVVDEYGSLLGIVTLEDILEEIVGEIDDEHDKHIRGVHLHPDGSYVVQGDVTIRDLNRQFGWKLPDEEAATIAGLILHEARRIPEAGQSFLFFGFRFEIMRRYHRQITSIRIIPPSETAEADKGT